jgi:hypothetical protein
MLFPMLVSAGFSDSFRAGPAIRFTGKGEGDLPKIERNRLRFLEGRRVKLISALASIAFLCAQLPTAIQCLDQIVEEIKNQTDVLVLLVGYVAVARSRRGASKLLACRVA